MNKRVRKAVIPAAGFGTRFLPATKAQPKEMLPIVDKPIIQYVVEDAVSAGIEDIIIVTGWSKRSIEDHFDYPFELETRLAENGKLKELESIRKVADMANFYYLRQKGPQGNGTPVWNAYDLVGDEPFLLLSGDDVFEANPTRSQQLIQAYEKLGTTVISTVKKNQPKHYGSYGYVEGKISGSGLLEISKIIEKPGVGNTVSEQAIVLGGVFDPDIFKALDEAKRIYEKEGSKGEFIIWEGLNLLLRQGKKAYALEIKDGKYFDCGNKLEYLKAVVEFGLKHSDLSQEFGEYLKNLKVE
ncbi:MAG: UTP--glucose-1-phosphate uridylyltransferase [Candidatus Doudnabacteria bacterium]